MYKISDEEFIKIVKESISIAQVIKRSGNIVAGGNYATTKLRIKRLEIDTSHFLGRGYLKGKTHGWSKKFPLSKILVEKSTYSNTSKLKNTLIKEKLLENKCSICGQEPFWNGKPLTLELDHKNGDRQNNCIENLRIVCLHCHSQTPTFRGRNKKCPERESNSQGVLPPEAF